MGISGRELHGCLIDTMTHWTNKKTDSREFAQSLYQMENFELALEADIDRLLHVAPTGPIDPQSRVTQND
jgi:hypothetical protein